MSTFEEKEQNWWKCSSFLEKIVQLLLQTRVDTRNYECVNFVDKKYQIDVPIFREFSEYKNAIRDQIQEIALSIYIFCENTSTATKHLCEVWEITCDLITSMEAHIATSEIEVEYLKRFISVVDTLPAHKLSTTIRSSPNLSKMNFEMNPNFQLSFEPSHSKIRTTFFPALRSQFGTLSMKVIYDESCEAFSKPKYLDNYLLSGSYLQSDNQSPKCDQQSEEPQLIHKQREEDPIFLKFLQSSCPIELLNSSTPISPDLMNNVRTFYEKNLCN